MDNEFGLDLAEIFKSFDESEVISLYFPVLARTLVIDLRPDSLSDPIVRVMPMVNSAEERYRSLKRLRPRLGQPDRVALVPWPRTVDSVVRLGVWDRLLQRLAAGGYRRTLAAAEDALDELRAVERDTLHGAIKGKGFRTVWARSR